MQFHSLRHHPFANTSQSRFCREKARGICSILRRTFAPWNAVILNPFSRAPFSLQLCTFTQRYGFEAALKVGVLETSTDAAFEINSGDQRFDNSSG